VWELASEKTKLNFSFLEWGGFKKKGRAEGHEGQIPLFLAGAFEGGAPERFAGSLVRSRTEGGESEGYKAEGKTRRPEN